MQALLCFFVVFLCHTRKAENIAVIQLVVQQRSGNTDSEDSLVFFLPPAEVEKDLAKLAEVGKMTTRSTNSPHSGLHHSPLRHRTLPDTLPLTSLLSRPQSPAGGLSGKPCGGGSSSGGGGLPLLSPKSNSLLMGRTPSNPGSRTHTPRTPSRPLTPNSLLTRSSFNPSSHKEVSFRRSRSRPVTPTSQPTLPRPLLTPPGLSTTDSLGASLRAYLSEVRYGSSSWAQILMKYKELFRLARAKSNRNTINLSLVGWFRYAMLRISCKVCVTWPGRWKVD